MEGGSRVVHGGIQAVLLDEVMGAAVQRGFQEEGDFVTAEMSLRYRRPANVEQELLLRAELKRSEGRDYFVEGEILDSSGEVLTRASARWVKLGTTPEPRHG
jgi:acyl-coenzyme A thioesterase PaaI-like protein